MQRPSFIGRFLPWRAASGAIAYFVMAALTPVHALPDSGIPAVSVDFPVPRGMAPPETPLPPELWANLTPEERERMRVQIRQHWEQLPPEERERRRDMFRRQWDMGPPPPQFPRRADPWQQISPEERQQLREMIRERRGFEPPDGRR